MQLRLENLEGDCRYKGTELDREVGQRVELQKEILTLRKELKTAKEHISSLESSVS